MQHTPSVYGKQLIKCDNKKCIDRVACERATALDQLDQCYAVFRGITKITCPHYITNIDAMRGKV